MAIRQTWICAGKCSRNDKCCQFVVKSPKKKVLFVKYSGNHTTDCTPWEIVRKEKHNYKDGALSVQELPEEIKEGDIFIIKSLEEKPRLQHILNDGRSYKKTETHRAELTDSFEKVYNYTCRGSYIYENQACAFFDRYNIIHQSS